MINQETLVNIHVLYKQGYSIRAIARELGISKNTVKKYLRTSNKAHRYRSRPCVPSILENYKPYIKERIAAAAPKWIPASVLFREIKEQGYEGGQSTVRQYVRQFKSVIKESPIRFETKPGVQLQVDFTTIRRGKKSIKAFVATLGYSRSTYVKFYDNERQESWLDGISCALEWFGGVPKELLFDNAKCIMLERNAYGDEQHRWNPKLLDTSKHFGFKLKVCRPYRAQTKGKVERYNGYLKSSFITPLATTLKQAGLELTVEAANAHIGAWLLGVSEQRIHGTTGEQPAKRLVLEREHMLALPVIASSIAISAPPIISKTAPPIESFQHPLSTYDQLIGAIL